jgi:hypothetical protein
MYFLTIGVDNDRRLFKAQLDDDALLPNRDTTDYRFVVRTPPQTATDLLRLPKSESLLALFTDPVQPPEDVPLKNLRFHLEESEDGRLDLILEAVPNSARLSTPTPGGIDDDPAQVPTVPPEVPAREIPAPPPNGLLSRRLVELVETGDSVRLRRAAHWAMDENLDVYLTFRRGTQSYSARFVFHLCRPEQFCQAVLDFGSEASQMAYKLAGRPLTQMPLVNIFRDHYFPNYPQHEAFRRRFYQHDDDHPFLFRSYYLIRETPDAPNVRTLLHERPRPEGNVLSLRHLDDDPLPPRPDAVPFRQIPNLKLLDASLNDFEVFFKGKGRWFSGIKDEILLTLLNQFLQALAAEVRATLDTLGREDAFAHTCLRLTLLVPNLYSQERVLELSQYLMDSLGRFSEPFFRGLEVQTISESDASFLGYLSDRKVNLRADARYLIIDSGKGTTDLSIVRTKPTNPEIVESVYRTGFAGAGNVLTYAFLETLLNLLFRARKPNEARRFLFEQIVQADKAYQNQLVSLLDGFKRQFPERPTNNLATVLGVQSGSVTLGTFASASSEAKDITTVIGLLRRLKDLDEPLEDYFGLVSAAVDELTQKIEEHLEYSGERKIHTVILAGRAFLFKPFRQAVIDRLRRRWKNLEVVFDEGQNAKTHCITGPLNHPGFHHFTDLLGVPSIKQVRPVVLSKLFGGEGSVFSPATDDFFEKGFHIPDPDTRRVYLGGWEYTVPNNIPLGRNHALHVLFTRRGLFARSLQRGQVVGYGELETTQRLAPKDDDLLKKSLFPHLRAVPSAEAVPLRWVDGPPFPIPTSPGTSVTSLPNPAVPRSDVPRTEVPRTEMPRTEVPRSDVPRSDVPRTDVTRTAAPHPEAPRTETPPVPTHPEPVPEAAAPVPPPEAEPEPAPKPEPRPEVGRFEREKAQLIELLKNP